MVRVRVRVRVRLELGASVSAHSTIEQLVSSVVFVRFVKLRVRALGTASTVGVICAGAPPTRSGALSNDDGEKPSDEMSLKEAT